MAIRVPQSLDLTEIQTAFRDLEKAMRPSNGVMDMQSARVSRVANGVYPGDAVNLNQLENRLREGNKTGTQLEQGILNSLMPYVSHNWLTGRDAAGAHPGTAVSNTPAGAIAATTVQAAINELDTEKLAKTYALANGYGITGAGDFTAARTISLSGVGARVYNSTDKVCATGGNTVQTHDTEEFDTHGFHSAVSDTHLFTIPAGLGGLYLVGAGAIIAANGTGIRRLFICRGGDGNNLASVSMPGDATIHNRLSTSTAVYLSAGNTLEMRMYQNSGGNLSVLRAADISAVFWLTFLGA